MQTFSSIKISSTRPPEVASLQNWIEKFVCAPQSKQNVINNRCDDFDQPVTKLMFDNRNRWAHVCPFVRDSLDYDMFWMELSSLDGQHPEAIERLLRQQMKDFQLCEPAYNPVAKNKAAEFPVLWKTFMTFFPIKRHSEDGVAFPLFKRLHDLLKPDFVQAGLMLGQFYAGCPQEGIYNRHWPALQSPRPAFAIRYMAKHDKLFVKEDQPEYVHYQKFFGRPDKNQIRQEKEEAMEYQTEPPSEPFDIQLKESEIVLCGDLDDSRAVLEACRRILGSARGRSELIIHSSGARVVSSGVTVWIGLVHEYLADCSLIYTPSELALLLQYDDRYVAAHSRSSFREYRGLSNDLRAA